MDEALQLHKIKGQYKDERVQQLKQFLENPEVVSNEQAT